VRVWPPTGTLVRETSRVRPRRPRDGGLHIMGREENVVKYLRIVPPSCS
jgi:hypothetical protein